MTFPEAVAEEDRADDPIPLSALQHYLFCPRQCALIHIERAWAENVLTAEGRLLHERTEQPAVTSRPGARTVHGMPLRSRRLGVAGVADVVELIREGGRWRPHPVEYKRGRPKAHRADEVQLCAQALCLEEMFETSVADGALFYGKTRRRVAIAFDDELRGLTIRIAAETRAMLISGCTPKPVFEAKRCNTCSLLQLCRPRRLERAGSIGAWLRRRIEETQPPCDGT